MDRTIIQNGEGLRSADFLLAQRSAMIGLAKQAAASLGSGPLLDGLAVTPAGGLTVSVAPGAIYALANVDATPYGTLTADTTHSVLKQGLLMDAVTLSCPAPGTGGQSINYLVEVQFQENDGANTGLPFYNSATPTVPSFINGNTLRQDVCAVQVKAGTAAATGSQTTPAPDAGWTAAYVVTVANAQATIITANISVAPGAPFLTFKTRDLAVMFAVWPDTGAANALVITPQPALTALTNGLELTVSPANVNTTAATIAVNGLAATPIVNPDGSALVGGEFAVGTMITLLYRSGSFYWQNSLASSANAVAASGAIYTATGTANALVIAPAVPVTARNGLPYSVKPIATNTAAATLSATGSALPIVRSDGAALQAGDIEINKVIRVTYDPAGPQWRILQTVPSQVGISGLKPDGNGNVTVDIDGLASKITPSGSDEVMIWDVAGTANKKVTLNNLTLALALTDSLSSEIKFNGMM